MNVHLKNFKMTFYLSFIYYLRVYTYVFCGAYKVKGHCVVSALFFHHVSPGSGTQFIRLGCKYLHPLSYLLYLDVHPAVSI